MTALFWKNRSVNISRRSSEHQHGRLGPGRAGVGGQTSTKGGHRGLT